ncbi:MAG: thermonuclease family protein [Deltaproteobacteria bacterium]|nr:thermonuclease family protein [Deltaproteobacteria bacterium]
MQLTRLRPITSLVILALAAVAMAHCSASQETSKRYSRDDLKESLKKFEESGLVIGEYTLARDAVLDGDTIRVKGLKNSLRLLAIDTEETFKHKQDRVLFEKGWGAYLEAKRAGSSRPVKAATPLGEEAKAFAKAFFKDLRMVRLERDHPKESRGYYNRYLAYVFAPKDGRWVNYNLECVRAGMSPYFTKYSYSRRFHDEFVAAEKEARKKGLGIWSADGMHYDDYPERIAWWNGRGDFIRDFEKEAVDRPNYVLLTRWDAMRQIEALEGKRAVILASVGEIVRHDSGLVRVMLSRRKFADFPLVFYDREVFERSGIERWRGEFVRVAGTITRYRSKRTGRSNLQMVIKDPGQVVGMPLPAHAMETKETEAPAAEENHDE